MTLDWQNFTPWAALIGGALIGLASGIFIILNGRIAGISGIIGGLIENLLSRTLPNFAWRLAFILGLMAPPLALWAMDKLPTVTVEANTGTLLIAGLLVGLGTRYASGCTSGHGVCGISRFSTRSLVATCVFMAAGFITVYLHRHG